MPQGSVLGPLLFIIYINDLANIFPGKTIVNLFGDDAKLYSTIKSHQDVFDFQICFNLLTKWANDWQLAISTNKCSLMDLGLCKTDLSKYSNNIDLQS